MPICPKCHYHTLHQGEDPRKFRCGRCQKNYSLIDRPDQDGNSQGNEKGNE